MADENEQEFKKMTAIEFSGFIENFYKSGKALNLRLGQAFLNELYPDLVCPDIFYEEDDGEAVKAIIEKFVHIEPRS